MNVCIYIQNADNILNLDKKVDNNININNVIVKLSTRTIVMHDISVGQGGNYDSLFRYKRNDKQILWNISGIKSHSWPTKSRHFVRFTNRLLLSVQKENNWLMVPIFFQIFKWQHLETHIWQSDHRSELWFRSFFTSCSFNDQSVDY